MDTYALSTRWRVVVQARGRMGETTGGLIWLTGYYRDEVMARLEPGNDRAGEGLHLLARGLNVSSMKIAPPGVFCLCDI
jgi:hypothetical protein